MSATRLGEGAGERDRANGAGEEAEERDPHLDRRQEARRILDEGLRGARRPVSLVGELAQPMALDGDQRDLARREEAGHEMRMVTIARSRNGLPVRAATAAFSHASGAHASSCWFVRGSSWLVTGTGSTGHAAPRRRRFDAARRLRRSSIGRAGMPTTVFPGGRRESPPLRRRSSRPADGDRRAEHRVDAEECPVADRRPCFWMPS